MLQRRRNYSIYDTREAWRPLQNQKLDRHNILPAPSASIAQCFMSLDTVHQNWVCVLLSGVIRQYEFITMHPECPMTHYSCSLYRKQIPGTSAVLFTRNQSYCFFSQTIILHLQWSKWVIIWCVKLSVTCMWVQHECTQSWWFFPSAALLWTRRELNCSDARGCCF